MKVTISIFFIAVQLALAVASFAQPVVGNSKPNKVYPDAKGHGIGAIISSSNGKGLCYRYWPKEFGFHLAFTPVADKDNKYYNIGFTGYKTLREYKVVKLFAQIGAEYQYKFNNEKYYGGSGYPYYNYQPIYSYQSTTSSVNVGAGAGAGLHFGRISLDAFLGYGAYFINNTLTGAGPEIEDRDNTIITFSGGVSMFIEL